MSASSSDALDILANAVSRLEEIDKTTRLPTPVSEHRVSCHRCGNIRKKKLCCPRHDCPHIFCGRCADKLRLEHGEDVFLGGCPVCKELCCCSNKTIYCDRKNHCYRKCPSTKSKLFNNPSTAMPCHPNAVHSSSGTGRDSKWDQDAKNCRAPALDFLASIVTNSGPDVHALPGVIGISGAIGVGLGGVISESGLRKSDSTKSFASQSSASSSADSKKTPFDGDFINRNGKRTPCESPAPETKLLKVESSISSKMMTIPEGTNGGGNQSAIFSNLPMPAGQIPHMNNNGQFNQSFLLEQSGHMSDANTQNFVLANQVPGVAEGQKLREDMTFPYYTQQQSLVYPVSSFSSGPGGSNAVEQATE